MISNHALIPNAARSRSVSPASATPMRRQIFPMAMSSIASTCGLESADTSETKQEENTEAVRPHGGTGHFGSMSKNGV
ncbi:hypothetical protein [Lyngbya sp. CCY1209]|uniref:hypothetical protein n=1 Tax=Lyngbya sp. CCY1209 TaxID=2886103 RepID=UPI002D20FC25|nr:hypothetical protein [Lyngbya sp. CCY1209]MEB3884674.1 hypothetical protein [Lyngbya sp. CCY1209]